jgi:Arc/MetJ-type ribon-helix-helix transcriptional regulator
MKNITVSVPEHVDRDARVRAAERGTSVSALVAEFLATLSEHEAEFARLEAQRRAVIARIEHFSAGDRLDRDALHERAVR